MTKEEKRMGKPSLKEKKNPHPDIEKATPAKRECGYTKPWGYSYIWTLFGEKQKRTYQWYSSERGRDQAYERFKKRLEIYTWYTDLQKEKR